MKKKHRYTGEFPPIEVWESIPNWEYALDEESVERQDETTLRPALKQDSIIDGIAFTAADATLASSQKLPVLLEVYTRLPSAINVFRDNDTSWRIYYSYEKDSWVPYIEDWLPVEERSLWVSLDDTTVFPMRIQSRLPVQSDGKLLFFTINSDGNRENI